MHKLLVHCHHIMRNLDLPIGMYSEEALESRNKDSKNIREYHTRKCNRLLTMSDLFCGLHVIDID